MIQHQDEIVAYMIDGQIVCDREPHHRGVAGGRPLSRADLDDIHIAKVIASPNIDRDDPRTWEPLRCERCGQGMDH